jgi:O18-antigen biosynthesis glycosyltransferase
MITILTPTFNRAHTLPRLFESLQVQSVKSFEWLVIDDGSTDETRQLIERLKDAQSAVPVRYIHQNNGGKHVAINTGVNQAYGSWIFIVDSDDALTPDAIESILLEIERLGSNNATGICFRKAYFDQSIIGTSHVDDISKFMHPTAAGRYFKGDLAYSFRTEELRKHPFPAFSGEKFVPELYIWNLIGDQGPVWYVPQKAIYLCEYLSDGYTANFKKNLKINPKGFGLFYRTQFSRENSWIAKIKCAVRAMQCVFYSVVTRR